MSMNDQLSECEALLYDQQFPSSISLCIVTGVIVHVAYQAPPCRLVSSTHRACCRSGSRWRRRARPSA